MPLEIRKRTKTRGTHIGSTFDRNTGVTSYTSTSLGSDYCEDVVGNRDGDNWLWIEHRYHGPLGQVDGTSAHLANEEPQLIWTAQPHGSQAPPNHITLNSSPLDTTTAATRGIARTNPGRPVVSLPVFIGELKDTVLNLFDLGERKRKKARHGNSVAASNFGWEPLFRDVAAIFQFGEHVNNRVKELQALHSASGLKRRWTTWEDFRILTYIGSDTLWSVGGTTVLGNKVHSTKGHQWVTTRWRPAVDGLPPTADQLLQQARFAVHGWRLSPADAWELIPWSWFIDYFANVGDFLQATSNQSEYRLESCCVCTSYTTTQRWRIHQTSKTLKVIPGVQYYINKMRVPSGAGLTVTQPFLSVRQITTLAGIAANHSKVSG